MFKKNLKLLATMVGLVAVLVIGLAMPGVTQGSFSRQALVNSLKAEIGALLTAAGASEAVDLEAAVFFSSRRATSAYIPPHASALSGRQIKDYLLNKAQWVFLGVIYVSADVPGVLSKGLYYIKAINRERVALINQEGEVIGTRWIKWFADPEETASLYKSYGDGAYFMLTARTGGDPGTQYYYDGGGGTPTPSPPSPGNPPPPNPPDPDAWKLSWTISVGVCTPTTVAVCITFIEVHI